MYSLSPSCQAGKSWRISTTFVDFMCPQTLPTLSELLAMRSTLSCLFSTSLEVVSDLETQDSS
jgi:hypothetical protein